MMETKLWTVLCALLLILNLGSADHVGDGHAAATESAGGAEVGGREPPPAEPAPASRLGHSSHAAPALNGSDANRSSNGTSSLSSNTTKVGETISQMNEPKKENETSVVLPPVSVVPQTTVNLTEASEPRILPPESHATTSHIPPATTTTTSITSPPHTAQNAPVDTPTTNTSNHSAPLPPHSTSTSQQPTHPNIHASTSAPTAKPETTTTTSTTTSTQSSSTSSTSSLQEPHSSVSQTLTSPHTSQSEGPRDLPKSTVTPPSNISAQSKAHADSPSQLNVGGDTTMVHESPTLDPLLAGLVSAFIITAVIITLLLFLKLRRRDSRPEFRRLQDLPMDDMMEDTPLSMYSY